MRGLESKLSLVISEAVQLSSSIRLEVTSENVNSSDLGFIFVPRSYISSEKDMSLLVFLAYAVVPANL